MIPVRTYMVLSCTLCACFRPNESRLLVYDATQKWPSQNASADPKVANNSTITVSQAVALALRYDGAIQRAHIDTRIAAAQVSATTQIENPQLILRNVEVDEWADGNRVWELSFRAPVPHPALLHAQYRQAQFQLEAAQTIERDTQRQVIGQLRKNFAALRWITQERAALQRLAILRQQQLQRLQEGVRYAASTVDAVSLALNRYTEIQADLNKLVTTEISIVSEIKTSLGISSHTQIHFDPTDNILDKPKTLQNAAVQVATLLTHAAEADLYIEKVKQWPWIRYAEIGYEYLKTPHNDSFRFALSFDLPIFSFNQGAIAVRNAQVQRQKLELQKAVLATGYDQQQKTAQVAQLKAELLALDRDVLPALKRHVANVAQSSAQQSVDPDTAIKLEEHLLQTQRRYYQRRLAYEQVVIDLQRNDSP